MNSVTKRCWPAPRLRAEQSMLQAWTPGCWPSCHPQHPNCPTGHAKMLDSQSLLRFPKAWDVFLQVLPQILLLLWWQLIDPCVFSQNSESTTLSMQDQFLLWILMSSFKVSLFIRSICTKRTKSYSEIETNDGYTSKNYLLNEWICYKMISSMQ